MRTAIILLFFIFFAGFINLKAQTNFIKGYYITNAQDSIHGYLDYRSEKRNYKLLVFKKDLNSKQIKLYPKDLLGFTVDNSDFYERHSFKSRKGEELYGFFKVILRGKLSLLRYQSRYFAKNSQGEIFEISKRKEVSDGKLMEDYYGLGMLKVLMKDCDEMTSDFLEKQYKSNPNFIDIFNKYNSCVGSLPYVPEKIIIKPHLNLGIQLSPTVTNLNLGEPMQNASFDKGFSFGFGGFASLFIPKVDENLRLVFEATYGKYSQYAYFRSGNTSNDLFIDYSSLKVPVFIRYNFNRFFLDVGTQNQFILNQDLRWRIETILQSIVYTNEGEVTPFKVWTNGYIAGLGFRHTVLDYPVRASVRFSHMQASNHVSQPVFQTIELSISVQLK